MVAVQQPAEKLNSASRWKGCAFQPHREFLAIRRGPAAGLNCTIKKSFQHPQMLARFAPQRRRDSINAGAVLADSILALSKRLLLRSRWRAQRID